MDTHTHARSFATTVAKQAQESPRLGLALEAKINCQTFATVQSKGL